MRAVAGLTDDLKLGIGFWIWRSLYGSWDKAANREGANPSLTCATVKANGAARKADERDKRATETRLRGWGDGSRTSEWSRELSL